MNVLGLVGKKLGRYTLTGILGEGGMAVVYRAVDPDDRELAIKVLPPWNTGGEQGRARFGREIEEARKLDHPNLVKVLDSGDEDGILFYCMDLVRGGTLESYLKATPLPPFDDAVHIIKGICKGLAYLHGRRVVHRDLKPANVFLVGERKDVVLGDYGLLKPLELDTLTPTNERLGTPAYMSPEQFKGTEIDPRSDIYQLGVLLFRLLTGKLPFDDPNFFTLAARHMTKVPPAPRTLNPEIPASLEKVILRCLAKKPADRYPDAGELGRDLNRYLIKKEMAVPAGDLNLDGGTAAQPIALDPLQGLPVGRPARLPAWLRDLPGRVAQRALLTGLGALLVAPALPALLVRLEPEPAALALFGLAGLGGFLVELVPPRSEAGLRLVEAWLLLVAAWSAGELALAPGRGLLGFDPLGCALALELVVVAATAVQSLGWKAVDAWKALYACSALLALGWSVELAYGSSPLQLATGEARVLAARPFAYLSPMGAPLAYGRLVHLPLTGLLAIAGGVAALQAEETARAVRAGATALAVLGVLAALARTVEAATRSGVSPF